MKREIDLEELNRILRKLNIEGLEDVHIEGDVEIELDMAHGGLDPAFLQSLGHEFAQIAMHLLNISQLLGYPVQRAMQPQPPQLELPTRLADERFSVGGISEWKHRIEEVTLGATSSDGGTRSHTITLGGEQALPYYFDAEMPHGNYITMDVFDMPIGMAKAVKVNYEDVMEDPAEWAKKVVREFNADMVTIHLISTDPGIKDTPPREAAKTVEDVLQAVKVPIVIGGSGNPEKDPEVLEAAAAAAEGERCLLASASLNLDYARIAEAAKKYDHVVLAWTQLEINAQKELNRKLMKQCGLERDRIVIDPTTAALGYGLDYAYTNMERIRIAGLIGDSELSFPISSGTTNAWGAREAWMVSSPISEDSDWGPREYRGPIWEIVTGLTLALAGCDLFMMMHPASVQVLKDITQMLHGTITENDVDIKDWITRVVV
ncbi:CO dehydrogenase/acetyl-CoA synthase subunit delta [Methermicoccus shengliensis]|uniref:Acetyl-CoA decarbonylase/synthase complex subunit delta n=1 Tax=Methermicoccus shengliensis TaxID=660064 RepID=A0A832RX20_9EURY|nr:CO dehydrogenase/acetyl-CoA synthase subunit delta [Methermicoccus shengliensis]KUK03989.1 MAG: Acetyl-CoA decarbonylase/synthase complex subunit delta [Euryarchaeota archaeon 55_53]KUK29542.1 MAG: Acetyl-CoA decarbonylase/synthase complex subunit delta [Methanosarcinales archeaon 56_1174]MDI3487615.1 acetyl-CoA decarbonylase/synthase, complex subunit delta [Methanosarcinales archaeon]MDN5294948.1 acetyl-CoA decarbonylase/synthase, complex subunit delta [Methanosarcinales archaeon]HIH69954.